MNEHRRAVRKSAIVAAVPGSGKGPQRSPVIVFGDTVIEEYPVNTCTASLADAPWLRCPPAARSMLRMRLPGSASAKNTA